METASIAQAKIDFKTYNYFSYSAVGMGYTGIGFGLFYLLSGSIGVGLFLLLAGACLVIPVNGIEIDFQKKEFNNYVTFLGIRKNEIRKFDSIECVFIQRALLSSRGPYSDDTLSGNERIIYNGYLKFSERDKIHIAKEKDKKKMIRKCMVFSDQLNIELFDCTSGVQVSLM